jgi:hypothetical protein
MKLLKRFAFQSAPSNTSGWFAFKLQLPVRRALHFRS